MVKNFLFCPHCAAKGKSRSVEPATAHRSPLVSRSDGNTFHLFLEESYVRRASSHAGWEVVALFRYDLDTAGIKGESTLLVLPLVSEAAVEELETAADELAEKLIEGRSLPRLTGSRRTA